MVCCNPRQMRQKPVLWAALQRPELILFSPLSTCHSSLSLASHNQRENQTVLITIHSLWPSRAVASNPTLLYSQQLPGIYIQQFPSVLLRQEPSLRQTSEKLKYWTLPRLTSVSAPKQGREQPVPEQPAKKLKY